jgi:serine/threonine-protein kinase
MEFVQGRTLRDILKAEGRLPARRAMEITADVCNALDFSHRNGLIHRDVKPANVMITPAGAVKVMDFGIARAVADTSATVTQTANVIGTAQYLSPEQARGEPVDARSDVYSTGCLLYELVTGVPPFQGDSPVAVAYQHVRENPVLPSARNPEVPRAVDSIVMKALAKNQFNRYQSAGDMRADLQRALADQPVVAEAAMTEAERTQFIARTPTTGSGAVFQRNYDPEPEEDNHRRAGLIWAAVVVVLLAAISAGAYLLATMDTGGGKKVVQVAVPDVIGQTPSAAKTMLTHAGFHVTAGNPTSDKCDGPATVKEHLVCTTSPGGGVKLDKGSEVTYHVYEQQTEQVPAVEGKLKADAINILARSHLQATVTMINNIAPAGTVVHQNPQPYSKPVPVGYHVQLAVSRGKVRLPDVTGLDYEDAVTRLNSRNYHHVELGNTITTSVLAKNNKVEKESPMPGKAYPPDQEIILDKYVYVAPPPTCASTPAPPTGSLGSGSTPASGTPSSPAAPTTAAGSPTCVPG